MNSTKKARLLYEQRQLPIFQNRMYNTQASAKACPTGDIFLVEDMRTGLVYNDAFRSELMVYDVNYQNEQAVSPLFRRHLDVVAKVLERTIGRNRIVEVGCGKGFFLEFLLQKGFDVVGFDPTYEGTNPRVQQRYFDTDVGIQAYGVVVRHVLEHIEDPYDFLLEIKQANGGSGKIYIEVPCFDWICEHRAWYDVFHEHVNYFRATDFSRMFDSISEIGKSFGGQYLYVVADLESLKRPVYDCDDPVRFPEDFTRTLTGNQESQGRDAVVWGGASKGAIFALLKGRMGCRIDAIIDMNPAKQGKYLPASGLLVQCPKAVLQRLSVGADIYVMNSNYLPEIKEMSGNKFNYIEIEHE